MRTKFSGILTLLLAFVVQLTFAQEKTISGTVADDTGLPLPGVNILIKGTNTGTQSDFDGNYAINANVGQTIVFSYVGFKTTERAVTSSTNSINLNMESDAAVLDAIVVTGYSNRNQTVQTSAVVSISAADINQMAPTTSIDNLLQGKAAGVQVTAANGKPGQGAFVRIRGTGSLTAGASSPLYLVDGAPIREQELSNIPNEDIENITILKDAATTARYGSRGANGVVVITTKNGNRNKDAVIRFSSRYGVNEKLKDNYTMMDAAQKMQYEAELFALGVTAAASLPGVTTAPGSPERQFLLDNAIDWQDLILQTGIIQNNNFSISGGTEKSDYYFSVGHDRNTGLIDQINGFERLGTRFNANFDPKEWLALGVNVGYSRTESDEPRDRNNAQNPFRAMYTYNAYETEFLLNPDGTPQIDVNGNPIYNPTSSGFPIRGALLSEPAVEYENTTLASVDALVKFNSQWSYGLNVAVNSLNRRTESYSKPGGILQNLIGNAQFPGNKLDGGVQRMDFTISNRLNYNLVTENHNLNVLGLYEYNTNIINAYSYRSIGFPTAALSTQSNAAQVESATSTRSRLSLLSYGVFADYDYQQKYLLSGSYRRDASSNFGKDVKFGDFYSVSAGWNIAREDFFNIDAINTFKIRGSYGTVGNRNGITRYAPLNNGEFVNVYPGGSALTPFNVGNPDLKWETTTNTNIGLELDLFNSRIRAVADYFIRDTEDLLFQVRKPVESGVSFVFGNAGELHNEGLELSLQADIFRTPDFTWTLGGNALMLNDYSITSLPEGEDVTPFAFNILWREGQLINEHYLIRYAGVDPNDGQPLYYGVDGQIHTAQGLLDNYEEGTEHRVFQGKSTIADLEGGFFSNVVYKGFGLRTDFVYKSGNWINNFQKENAYSDGVVINSNHAVGAFNYWQQPGDTNVEPSPIYRNDATLIAASDRFLEKGDYIRLRNVTFSYTFPNRLLERSPLSSLRVYVQGQNLLTFTDFWGDPEVGISSGETIPYADSVAPGESTLYSYPNAKSFQFGIDVSF